MGVFYALLTAVSFSLLEPVSKVIAGQINPYAITFIRFFIGALILMPFSLKKLRRENLRLTKKDVLIMAALGSFMICTSMIVLQIAVKMATSPSVIAIVFCTNSVMTIVISSVVFKDRMNGRKLCALLLCVAGICLCVDVRGDNPISAVALAFFAAVCFSVYTVISKRYMTRLPGTVQTGVSFLLGSLVLLVILLVSGVRVLDGVTRASLVPLLILGVVVTGLGYTFYFKAMEISGAGVAALAFFIKPVMSPFVALLVNKTPVTWNVICAALLVLCGSYLNSAKSNTASQ